jgi:16S rRNA (cytosine1402-N4)-methyltransferase
MLEASAPDGRLLGLDVDSQALDLARETLAQYGSRVILQHASYASMQDVMRSIGWEAADGVLLDLGVSSMQLEIAERGFSFQHEAPLDMRFDQQAGMTAADLVNMMPEEELADLLLRYGEERHARRIAHLIVESRPLHTTTELATIVRRAYRERTRIHPATRTFQALRIAVNDELTTLEQGLNQALAALRPGGRLAVISFHSLEDRMVKRFMRQQSGRTGRRGEWPTLGGEASAVVREVSRKPAFATDEEVLRNPRARSARLRVAEKL